MCVSVSPSDKKFATGGDDSSIKIWDLNTHGLDRELKGFISFSLAQNHISKKFFELK